MHHKLLVMTAKAEKKEQSNIYAVHDSMGRRLDKYVMASNIKEAYQAAKKMNGLGNYFKLKRCYNGGVRG